MNPHEMDSGYPDSLNSSPGSRETDSDHRWEAHDSGGGGGSRVRLMCSFGGKIQQRSHDNQLSYVGGDTRILAVDRNIRFASMVEKLSSLWGNSVSFKYQLPNEDLDALVSVTNDEDMENMMVENDRLQKMSCRSSRLRLFVFPDRHDETSPESNFGALVEERKRENWFVDAHNVGLVNRSESAGARGPWVKNMPDFLFGLGGNGVEDDRDSGRRGYSGHETNSKDQEVYMGRELRLPETGNYPRSGHSSIDSTASAPARLNSTHHKPVDSSTVPEIGTRKGATDRMANTNTNTQKQEQHASEFSVVSSSPTHEREPQHPQHPQLQVPIQEFQKFHLRQPEEAVPWPVDPNTKLRKIYSGHERAVEFSNNRPDLTQDQPYMEAQNHQRQFPPEYYTQDQRSHFVAQSYQQMPDPHGDHLYPIYFAHPESPGQPTAAYYNPVQTVTSPVQVYSPEAAAPVSTARAAMTAHRKGGSSDHTETYRDVSQIHAPVFKGPYTQAPSGQVASGYRPVAPVPHGHTEPYPYQNAVYEPSSRQVYYTQAPMVMNPQYQLSSSGNVSPLDFHDSSSSEVS